MWFSPSSPAKDRLEVGFGRVFVKPSPGSIFALILRLVCRVSVSALSVEAGALPCRREAPCVYIDRYSFEKIKVFRLRGLKIWDENGSLLGKLWQKPQSPQASVRRFRTFLGTVQKEKRKRFFLKGGRESGGRKSF